MVHLEPVLTFTPMPAAKKTAFDSYEAEIFEELQALVADAGALHTFLEAALKLESSALTSAIGSQPTTIFDVSGQCLNLGQLVVAASLAWMCIGAACDLHCQQLHTSQ